MTAFGKRLRAWFRKPAPNRFNRFEDMPHWLLHDIGRTRDGTKTGPYGLPLAPDGIGRVR